MIITLSGTNRPGSNTKIVSEKIHKRISDQVGQTNSLFFDLANLRQDIFDPKSYGAKPSWFTEEYQTPILKASGLFIVTPEYNGSFPGVLKYFIDMLKFPESLVGLPVAIVGIAAGQFGALRAVEQLEAVLHYRKVHLFGERLFVSGVHNVITPEGSLGEHDPRLEQLVTGFVSFVRSIKSSV